MKHKRETTMRFAVIRVISMILALETAMPFEAWAQARKMFLPSASIASTYDDNVSAQAGGDRDVMTQVRPRLEGRYESPRLALLSVYSFDMQRSARHADLNSIRARQQLMLDARVRPTSTTTLGIGGRYDTTESPGDFIPATVVLIERRRAYRWQATPSITKRVSPLTTLSAQYDLMQETLVDSAEGLAGVLRAGFRVQWSRRTVHSVSYVGRRFVNRSEMPISQAALPEWSEAEANLSAGALLASSGPETYISHAALLGWTRQITPRTSLTVQAGPRFASDGQVGPEVAAGLSRTGPGFGFALGYSSAEFMVVGVRGPVEARSASARLTWPIGRTMQIGTTFSASDSMNVARSRAQVYGAAMEVGWSPNGPGSRWPYSIGVSYGANFQTGELRIDRQAQGQLFRRVFVVRLTTPLRPRQSTQPPDEPAAPSEGVQR